MKIRNFLVYIFLLILGVFLIGCNNSKDKNELLKFENILFESKTFEYDETLKRLEISGLPADASVEYEYSEALDVGTYNAKAIVSKKGYETLTLTATLTITEGNLKGITFDDELFVYDGSLKKIEVKGLPKGADVKYESNQATEIGAYQATAIINKKGYKTLVLTANFNIVEAEFINLKFKDATYLYDGTLKTIEVSGLPEGAIVEYESNQSVNAGVYNAIAVIKKEGHTSLTLTATLTITPANFTGVIFKDKEYVYDGNEKILEAENLPSDAKVDYISNKATIPGTYQAKATITKPNYNDLVLNATLTITPAKIVGVAFKDKEYDYDSTEKVLEVENLPAEAAVKYSSNKAINAGIYQATATITIPYHEDLILNATLTINKVEITNLEFNNKTVEYDEQIHSIKVIGNLPSGSIVKYYYNDQEIEGVGAVGEYEVKAVILESQNYYGLVLTAVLKITSTEENLYSLRIGNKIYFQNNLDHNYLYFYENNQINKVNNHIPEYMIESNSNLYYYNKSLFSKDIMVYNGSKATSLASTKGEYLTTDGTYLYYAINNLLINTSQNGIYKLKINGSNDPIRLTTDKASFLTYHSGFIYYANNSNNKNLYKISINAVEDVGTLLWDEKVEYITLGNNNSLYFSSSKQILGIDVATAIYKYMINSNSVVKLTTDTGKYLTIINDDLYYINNDKITSFIFGNGIYKVSTLSTSDSSLPGTKVLEAPEGDGYSSLTSDGTNLYYYKLSDKHFYSYSVQASNEIDLMKNYQPENDIKLMGHVSIAEYKGEIYYINPLEMDLLGTTGGTLYKYNPVTNMNTKVLTNYVSNVYFYEDFMYYSTFVLTNYALFRMDMLTGEVIKIISARTDNLIFEDGLIYYIKVGSLYNNYIYQMELDGSNPTLIQNTDSLWVKGLIKDGNTFYYARNPKIYSENLSSYTIDDKNPVDYGIKARIVLLNNNKLYYYNHNNNTIGSVLLDTTNQNTLVSNVEVNSMLIIDNILYYSSTKLEHYGLYAYDLATNNEVKISDLVGDALTFIDNRLYFIQTAVSFTNDYPYHKEENIDGKLYYYDGLKVVKAN